MKVFIIGGTGFISGSLVRILLERGNEVVTFTRGLSEQVDERHPNLARLLGDRHDEAALRRAAGTADFDAVFDMIAYTPQESRMAANIFRDRVGRFVHCSTISVYMISDQATCPVTEDQDKLPIMEYWPRNPFGMDYGIQKRRCEDVLWEAHAREWFKVSMLRPTYVSGPSDPTIRDYFWIERILDEGPLLVPGHGEHPFQQVFVEDVARAFADLLDRPQSVGKAYNVAAEEVFTLNEYLRRLSALLQRDPELVHVRQEEFDALPFSTCVGADVFPFNTRRPAFFSLERIQGDLDYRSTPFDEWMSDAINWYLAQDGLHSHGYDRRAEELVFIRNHRRS